MNNGKVPKSYGYTIIITCLFHLRRQESNECLFTRCSVKQIVLYPKSNLLPNKMHHWLRRERCGRWHGRAGRAGRQTWQKDYVFANRATESTVASTVRTVCLYPSMTLLHQCLPSKSQSAQPEYEPNHILIPNKTFLIPSPLKHEHKQNILHRK